MSALPDGWTVTVAGAAEADDLLKLAAIRPLEYNDLASIARLQPEVPRVWIARNPEGTVEAAAVDDGLAMTIAGSEAGLKVLAAGRDDLPDKLVIAGRANEVATMCRTVTSGRTVRSEHFMAVDRDEVLKPTEAVDIRIATVDDLPLLRAARVAALEEEYGIEVPEGGELERQLHSSVARAVEIGGVAIWIEDFRVAFTAQLISKTPVAAMFGDLYTDPALRGAGRATKALSLFCAWLMTESDHVTLRVSTANEAAVRLYERTGFTVFSEFASSVKDEVSSS
jgi:ribosomal protein S18 acetylase RimI-like enzyme